MIEQKTLDLIRNSIRLVENWPENGVSFRDITTLLQDPIAFQKVIEIFVERYRDKNINVIAGLDARGFIFGPIIAYELGVGFVPIRKQGKLPYKTIADDYILEYGDKTTVEIHIDAIKNDDNVVIIDDLIATGGTMIAACNLIKKLHGNIIECGVVNDLLYLGGSKLIKKKGYSVFSILEYR